MNVAQTCHLLTFLPLCSAWGTEQTQPGGQAACYSLFWHDSWCSLVVLQVTGGYRCELLCSLLTQGLWGTAHTWKHFRASLHCNWAYYHNYSVKAPAICIRHAPAQPAGLWPRRAASPPFHFIHTPLCLRDSFSRLILFLLILPYSSYINIIGEKGFSVVYHVVQLVVHVLWDANSGGSKSGPRW